MTTGQPWGKVLDSALASGNYSLGETKAQLCLIEAEGKPNPPDHAHPKVIVFRGTHLNYVQSTAREVPVHVFQKS